MLNLVYSNSVEYYVHNGLVVSRDMAACPLSSFILVICLSLTSAPRPSTSDADFPLSLMLMVSKMDPCRNIYSIQT